MRVLAPSSSHRRARSEQRSRAACRHRARGIERAQTRGLDAARNPFSSSEPLLSSSAMISPAPLPVSGSSTACRAQFVLLRWKAYV